MDVCSIGEEGSNHSGWVGFLRADPLHMEGTALAVGDEPLEVHVCRLLAFRRRRLQPAQACSK